MQCSYATVPVVCVSAWVLWPSTIEPQYKNSEARLYVMFNLNGELRCAFPVEISKCNAKCHYEFQSFLHGLWTLNFHNWPIVWSEALPFALCHSQHGSAAHCKLEVGRIEGKAWDMGGLDPTQSSIEAAYLKYTKQQQWEEHPEFSASVHCHSMEILGNNWNTLTAQYKIWSNKPYLSNQSTPKEINTDGSITHHSISQSTLVQTCGCIAIADSIRSENQMFW